MKKAIILGVVLLLTMQLAFAAAPVIHSPEVEMFYSYVKFTWRTNMPSDSRVDYGVGGTYLWKSKSAYTTNHELVVTALEPDTTYTYKLTSCIDGECSSTSNADFTFIRPDVTAPVLLIDSTPDFILESSVDVTGSVSEPSLLTITQNGEVGEEFSEEGDFTIPLTLVEGTNTFTIVAVDFSGNRDSSSFTINADPFPTEILEINLDEIDKSSNAQQTVQGIVSKPNVEIIVDVEGDIFSAFADSEGRFSIDIKLKTSLTGTQSANLIIVKAVDAHGREDMLVEGSISFIQCGSGSGYSTQFFDITPDVIIPQHLINGMAQIGFRVNFRYIGGGKNAFMTSSPHLTIQTDMGNDKLERSDEELFGGAIVECNEARDQCYFLINLAPWHGTREELGEKWNLHLPLELKLQYTHEVGGAQQTRNQDICIDISTMIDKDMLYAMQPGEMLNSSIELMGGLVDSIDAVRQASEVVKTATIASCFGATLWDFYRKVTETFSCTDGNKEAKDTLIAGGTVCPSGESACQSCLDAKIKVRKGESFRNLVCDRLFCPSAPTLDYHKETYYDSLTETGSQCVMGYRTDACRDEYKSKWDTVSIINEYSLAREEAGVEETPEFTLDGEVAIGPPKKNIFGELDDLIRNSNTFCPAVKDSTAEIRTSQGRTYFIDADKQVYGVGQGIPAEMQGDKIVAKPESIPDEFDWWGPLDVESLPPDIKAFVKGEEEVVENFVYDPTGSIYNSFWSGCLPAWTGYLAHTQSILTAVEQCLQMVAEEGQGTPGICKAVLSQYVCDIIWESSSCMFKGISSGSQSGRFESGLLNIAGKVANASLKVSKSVSDRYGSTGMFDAMFKERKLMHGACIYFFTGDVGAFDLNSMFSAEVAMPTLASEGIVAPATMRYLTSNPFQGGWATFMYHIGYAINSGSEVDWTLKLVCSNDMTCPQFGGNGACDCFSKGEEMERVIASNVMPAGEFHTDEIFVKITEPVRFNKVVLEWSYVNNNGEAKTATIDKKIGNIGGPPPSYCAFDPVIKEYKCDVIIEDEGAVFFVDVPTPLTTPREEFEGLFRVGDKFILQGQIAAQQREGFAVEPRFLLAQVFSDEPKNLKVSEETVQINTPGSHYIQSFTSLWPEIKAEMFQLTPEESECSRYDYNHPARWHATVALLKGVQDEQGVWKPSGELVLHEGQPQEWTIDGYVACTEEAHAGPQCVNGLLTSNPDKCMCGGILQDPTIAGSVGVYCCRNIISGEECDEANPVFSELIVKKYFADSSDASSLDSTPRKVSNLENQEVLLLPEMEHKIEFTNIFVEDRSNVAVYFREFEAETSQAYREFPVYSMGPSGQTGPFVWDSFDMAGFTQYPFKFIFRAIDENGHETFFPSGGITVKLKEDPRPAMS